MNAGHLVPAFGPLGEADHGVLDLAPLEIVPQLAEVDVVDSSDVRPIGGLE